MSTFRQGVEDAVTFWLYDHPVSLGETFKEAVAEATTKWLDRNYEAGGVEIPAIHDKPQPGLLRNIIKAMDRESLRDLLGCFEGASLRGNVVTLYPGGAGEFIRGAVKNNIRAVSEAATLVLGYQVKAVIQGGDK